MGGIKMNIKQLLQAKEFFRNNPDGVINIPDIWPPERYTAVQWNDWFMDCLNQKINRNRILNGRKTTIEHFWELKRAQRLINSRCIIDWLPADLLPKFSHRLRKNMEV
jgi:hypothetical protein